MIYEDNILKRILIDGGYIEDNRYYFYVQDHLGNNRMVVGQGGAVAQITHYYPFGMSFAESTNASKQPYKYNGKELDMENNLNTYDYEARLLSVAVPRFTTMDPLAEKYYSINPYAYVANNPMRFVDPNGMDIWEINNQGKIVNQIKDKNQDAFYMVDKNGNRTYTTDTDGNKHYNSISFEYGTITDSKKSGWFRPATSFAVNSESSGAELFKFFADNTKIEYGLINTQNNGSTVMTNHEKGKVNPWNFIKKYHKNEAIITSITHNHPQNSAPSGFGKNSKSGDKFFVGALIRYLGYSPDNYVYQQKNNNLVLYDNTTQVIGRMSWGLVFQTIHSTKTSRLSYKTISWCWFTTAVISYKYESKNNFQYFVNSLLSCILSGKKRQQQCNANRFYKGFNFPLY